MSLILIYYSLSEKWWLEAEGVKKISDLEFQNSFSKVGRQRIYEGPPKSFHFRKNMYRRHKTKDPAFQNKLKKKNQERL